MKENKEDEGHEVVCTCTGTTKVKIKQLVGKGVDDLDKVASATGATTGCGSCDVTVLSIITEHKSVKKV